MYAVYRKFVRTPASFSIVLLETIFAIDPPEFLMNQGLQGPW